MNEFEYLKYNKELKGFYNAWHKYFPKQPHNKINLFIRLFKDNKREVCLKVNHNFNEAGMEIGKSIKFENGDKLVMSLNEKVFTISTFLNLNYQKVLKSIDYSVSIDRKNKKLKNCLFDLKFESLGNMVLSLNQTKKPRIENEIKILNEGQEKISKRKSSYPSDDKQGDIHSGYNMKFSYSNKINKYFDTKIILNYNPKEDNIFEFKTSFDLANTNLNFFSFNLMNFNLVKPNIKFTKNICGVNYVIRQNKNEAIKKDIFKLSPDKSSEKEIIESSKNKDESIILTAGIILQNLKHSSTYFGAFINKNKTSEFPISYKMGIYCSIDPMKNHRETPINISYKISPAFVSQLNYEKFCGKYKLALDSIRIYNEWSFKKLMNIKIIPRGLENASLGVYANLENFYWTELNFATTGLNYGISLILN